MIHEILQIDCTKLEDALISQCDVMITDPPYSPHVHSSAVSCTGSQGKLSNARKRDFGFDALGAETRGWIAYACATVRRWSVIYSDIESTHFMRAAATSAGATYIRTLPWVRWSMPQLSGDRPPQGREDLLVFHADSGCEDIALFYGAQKGKKAWNGPGNLTHLHHLCLRGDGKHPTEKPLDQALDLIAWFTDPGETVLDPFAGSATLGLACNILGRSYIGCELNPDWVAFGKARLKGSLSERDAERLKRWLTRERDSIERKNMHEADVATLERLAHAA